MEIAGVAIGVAGLGALFKTCVDLCDMVDSAKSQGAEYQILSTKLAVEMVRLSLWGENVGLSGVDLTPRLRSEAALVAAQGRLDPRLLDRRITKAVSDILGCMQQLFEDTTSLKRRYGLQPSVTAAEEALDLLPASEGNRELLRLTFRRAYERFQVAATAAQRNSTLRRTTKWVISDKKRFGRFVADLKGFNDSLSELFPDIDDVTRAQMIAEIKASSDANDLWLIEQAATGDHEQLGEAASVRFTEVSQHQATDSDTFSDTTTVAGSVNVNRLARQLDRLALELETKNKGSLEVFINHSWGTRYWGWVGWQGIRDEEFLYQREKELEYVKNPYIAWDLIHATDRGEGRDGNYARQDIEADKKFWGKFPGTTTVEGLGAHICEWAEINVPQKPETIIISTRPLPRPSIEKLVSRLRVLQSQKGIPWGRTPEQGWKELEEFIGHGSDNSLGARAGHENLFQVTALLRTLNRSEGFYDLREGGSVSLHFFTTPVLEFLQQIILAYEVVIRLKENDGSCSGFTGRVTAAMEVAERWIEGVRCNMQPDNKELFEVHSLVHERQVEGLIRFAEVLNWPYMQEMREFAENAYVNLRRGQTLNPHLWDWLFGTILPGGEFVFKIMTALVLATPRLQHLQYGHLSASLILPDRSYWRSRYVVGRVLGGMKGIKSVNGWVGPCPGVSDKTIEGWVRVQARPVEYYHAAKREGLARDIGDDDSGITTTLHSWSGDRTGGEWIRTIGDHSKWIIPMGPTTAPERCEFRALHLFKLPLDPNERPPLLPPNVTDFKEDWDRQRTKHRASIEIAIDGEPVTFTLYTEPTFVAAPRCIDGPHSVHERDQARLQNICNVRDLIRNRRDKGTHGSGGGVLIINATCEGGELVARAWCAETGQHAVVARKSKGDTCFACAVRIASTQCLGLGCLIWA